MNPYASPLRAPDRSGLPPLYLVTAEHDPLRDEGFAYADQMSAGCLSSTGTTGRRSTVFSFVNLLTTPTRRFPRPR